MATEIKTNGYNGMMLDAYKNAAETATYVDKNGERKKGVVAESPSYAYTESVGTPGSGESIEDLYRRAYEQQVAAANDRTAAQLAELQRQAEEQKSLAAEDYRRANEQFYVDYMKGEKTLPERLAAMGITGGAAETSEIALRNAYSGNVGENERARLLGERGIDSNLQAAQAQAQLANRDTENEALAQYYANLIAQRQQEEAKAKEQQQMRASALAEVGDYNGLVEMGILSDEEAQMLKNAWIAQNRKLAEKLGYVKKSSSGSRNGTKTPTLYEAAVASGDPERFLETARAAGYADEDIRTAYGQLVDAGKLS